MEKKRINKLVVPLTLKSVSLLGAMTIMATSIGGCTSKKNKNNTSDTSSIITSSNEEENKMDIDVITSNDSITNEEVKEEDVVSSEITNNSSNSTTNNNQSNNNTKPNQTKPSTNNNQSSNTTTNNQNSSSTTTTTQTSQEEEIYYMTYIPLTKDNINDIKTFKRAVCEVAKNTRGNFGGIWSYYYKKELYKSYGLPTDEFTYILSSLNQDYLTEETLNTLLGSYSEEDLKRFIQVLGVAPLFVEDARKINNWDGLILDSSIKKQFNDIEKGFLEYLNNNPKPLKELLENYDYNHNPLVGYYLAESCNVANAYSNLKDSEFIDKFLNLYWDMEEECEKEASEMYNKIHGKTKVLE